MRSRPRPKPADSEMIWRRRNQDEGAPQKGAGGEDSDSPSAELTPEAVGQRVESALQAAERAAARIRDDAQQWARSYKEESRKQADEQTSERVRELSELTDNMMLRVRAAAEQADELISSLEEMGRRLISSEWRSSRIPEPVSPARSRPVHNDDSVSAGARVLATQMAAVGGSRDEVATRLREEFGIQDPSAILDEIGL
jgi:hypothetical protein